MSKNKKFQNFSQWDFVSQLGGIILVRVIKCYFMQYSRLCHFLGASHVTLSYSLYRQVIFIVKILEWISFWISSFLLKIDILFIFDPLNPYLGDFGNVRERHFWTKNPTRIIVSRFGDFVQKSYFRNWASVIFGQNNQNTIRKLVWIFCPEFTDRG